MIVECDQCGNKYRIKEKLEPDGLFYVSEDYDSISVWCQRCGGKGIYSKVYERKKE